MNSPARAFVLLLVTIGATRVAAQSRLPVQAQSAPRVSSDYLYVWTAALDTAGGPDFLAVFDVRPAAGRYGKLITTVPVPGRGNGPHHTEHEMGTDNRLFANGFKTGQSFIFDLTNPAAPRIAKQFGDVAGMMHPHSFLRLPNGNRLATFQMQHDAQGTAPGGLAEITPSGAVVRTSSANLPGVDRKIRPYSALLLPAVDRIVTTTSDMDRVDSTRTIQIWRMGDLKLLHTMELPNGPDNQGYNSAEPRLLADGKTVVVSTFNCGLYIVDGVATGAPSARLVNTFPRKEGTACAVPTVAGKYYLVTVPAWSAIVSLDMSDPSHPREVSRLTFGDDDVPHWISLEPNMQRVVMTGYRSLKTRVIIARFDATTGALTLDERFREEGSNEAGFRFENRAYPHGAKGDAVPHGAVFSWPR